jgi:hypothetical protein
MDIIDPAVDRVAALGLAINAPVVALVRSRPTAPEPVGGVGQEFEIGPRATQRLETLEERARLRRQGRAMLPPQVMEHCVVVIEWHPGARMDQSGKFTLRLLGPERKEKIGEAPIRAARPGRTVSGVLRSPRAVGHGILRRAVSNCVADRVIFGQVVWIDVAGVQEAEMRRVNVALERLQIIAVALDAGHADLVIGYEQRLQRRHRRRLGLCPHIDPNQPSPFESLVGLRPHLMLEILGWRHARHIDAVALGVKLPAMIDAA